MKHRNIQYQIQINERYKTNHYCNSKGCKTVLKIDWNGMKKTFLGKKQFILEMLKTILYSF